MTRVHHEFSPVDVVEKYWKSGLNLMLGQAPLNSDIRYLKRAKNMVIKNIICNRGIRSRKSIGHYKLLN
jgi:hypothetical protein